MVVGLGVICLGGVGLVVKEPLTASQCIHQRRLPDTAAVLRGRTTMSLTKHRAHSNSQNRCKSEKTQRGRGRTRPPRTQRTGEQIDRREGIDERLRHVDQKKHWQLVVMHADEQPTYLVQLLGRWGLEEQEESCS